MVSERAAMSSAKSRSDIHSPSTHSVSWLSMYSSKSGQWQEIFSIADAIFCGIPYEINIVHVEGLWKLSKS